MISRDRIRERYSNTRPVEVPKHVKDALGWWFTDEELQWAEEQFRAAHPNAPEPVAKRQVLYLQPRKR